MGLQHSLGKIISFNTITRPRERSDCALSEHPDPRQSISFPCVPAECLRSYSHGYSFTLTVTLWLPTLTLLQATELAGQRVELSADASCEQQQSARAHASRQQVRSTASGSRRAWALTLRRPSTRSRARRLSCAGATTPLRATSASKCVLACLAWSTLMQCVHAMST